MQTETEKQASSADTSGCDSGESTATACATSEKEQPKKAYKLVRADLPSILMTMHGYTSPANAYLDKRIVLAKEASPGMDPQEAVRAVPHFEAIKDWTRENPDDAAKIVLCSVYLSNGRYVAQEEVVPPTPEEDGS